jgi:hypothetical protein
MAPSTFDATMSPTSDLVEGDLVTVVAQRDKVYSASTA